MSNSLQQRLLRRAILLGCAATTTMLGIAPAFAQDNAASEDDLQEVVVTGSRIARPNLESTVPVTSIGADDIFSTGDLAVGDLLNDLPALRSTFSQSNSQRGLGITGLNLLDLRGLGTSRTLVLVNGRRHVGSDILFNAVSPDVNTFPSDLIERIDVVTGGSSAVYGSDAIAGVVNFVLKRDFEGVQFRGQGGESKYGDASNYFGSVVAGTNFAEDRGNVAVNFEYAKQDAFYASDRPNLRKNSAFVVVDTDPPGLQAGSDNVPDRLFYNDVRNVTVSHGGVIQFAPAAGQAPCGRDALGAAFRCNYLFQPDGSFVPQSGTRIGLAPNGSFDGGNGSNSREGKLLAIYPRLERYSLNLLGHYTVSEAFEPFIEAKYVRTKSLREGSPAFFQGATIDGFFERPRFDNPFLTDANRAAINAGRAVAGLAPITNGATRLTLLKTMSDLGPRSEDATRETTRIVLGATGSFAGDWKYEASVNYGEFKEKTDVLNNLDQQRFILAMDSTRDPAGNIVCRSRIDATARNIYPFADPAVAQSRLAADVAACVPYNPFGEGTASAASLDYLRYDSTSVGSIKQFDVTAFVSGNSGNWFSLPAGPVGIAAGVEYRTEKNYFDADDVIQAGITFYNALDTFAPPTFKVKEVFGELRFPLLADKPFARELTLSAAGRSSEYEGKTGRVAAYNLGLDWAPIDSLRFRAGLARAVRAPNLSDLYSPLGQNFATVVDPCSARNIGTGAATRAANCRAAGIPASYDYVYTATLEIRSGGNPTLKEETSDSLTAGFVFQPESIPGLSLSMDYFNIKVDQVITSPTAQQILDACYDAKDLNNQFCAQFRRAGPAGGPRGEIQFQVLEGSLQQIDLNYAARNAVGVDTEASYKMQLGELGSLNTRVVYTHMLERNNYLDPSDPTRANRILTELGDPEDAFNVNFQFSRGKLTADWELRYLGKMAINNAEDILRVQTRPPENADYADRKYYPAVVYHDVRLGFDLTDDINVYLGVDNVADKVPPLGLTGTGEFSGIYETRGRFFYTGVKAKF